MIVKNTLWTKLLELKKSVTNKDILGWNYDGNNFNTINYNAIFNEKSLAFLLKKKASERFNLDATKYKRVKLPFNDLELITKHNICPNINLVLQNYWAIAVISHLKNNSPFIFIHSATSLDGYLATNCGHSHWIGNKENLTHSHRLRALFDGILIGSTTVINDKPSLNVRHVEGENPKRLILSNKCKDLSALKKITDCETYLIRNSKYKYDDVTNHFDKIICFEGESKEEQICNILQKIKQENISSVLVEGGGSTISTFIETKKANTIQFHLSPMLLGSGIKAVKLPEVETIDEALNLNNMQVTPIGNSFMVTASIL